MPGFKGFPPTAADFFARLEADNTKTFWQANKDTYERDVRAPMELLCAEIERDWGFGGRAGPDDRSPRRAKPADPRPHIGTFNVFRPYRDVRFSKDKSPYKTNIGAFANGDGGVGYYFHFDVEGIYAASGMYGMYKDQLARFRSAIDDPKLGTELESLVAAAKKAKLDVGHDFLKTAPRGYPKDHPRIELLRMKDLIAGRGFAPAKWFATSAAKKRISDTWDAAQPLNGWLAEHVGPTEEPADWRR